MIEQLPGAWSAVLSVVRVLLVVWAVVGVVLAVRSPAGAFVTEGKWRKEGWVAVCAVSALVFALAPFGFLGVIAMVATGVYFADVRPAVSAARR